jgi:hypothetical protein
VFPYLHLKTETDLVSEILFSCYFEFRMTDKVHKPNDSGENNFLLKALM